MDTLGMLFRKSRGYRGFCLARAGRLAETRLVSRPPRPILSTMDAPVGRGHLVPVTTLFCAGRNDT